MSIVDIDCPTHQSESIFLIYIYIFFGFSSVDKIFKNVLLKLGLLKEFLRHVETNCGRYSSVLCLCYLEIRLTSTIKPFIQNRYLHSVFDTLRSIDSIKQYSTVTSLHQ